MDGALDAPCMYDEFLSVGIPKTEIMVYYPVLPIDFNREYMDYNNFQYDTF